MANMDYDSDRFISIEDQDGNELLYEILFTFVSEDYGKNYVLVFPAGTAEEEEVEITAFSYTENEEGDAGELENIETDEEWDMVEEVLATFVSDNNEDDYDIEVED